MPRLSKKTSTVTVTLTPRTGTTGIPIAPAPAPVAVPRGVVLNAQGQPAPAAPMANVAQQTTGCSSIIMPTYRMTIGIRLSGRPTLPEDMAILDRFVGGQVWGVTKPGPREDHQCLKIRLDRCQGGVSIFQSPFALEVVTKLTDGIVDALRRKISVMPRYDGLDFNLTKQLVAMRTVPVPTMDSAPIIFHSGVSQVTHHAAAASSAPAPAPAPASGGTDSSAILNLGDGLTMKVSEWRKLRSMLKAAKASKLAERQQQQQQSDVSTQEPESESTAEPSPSD